MKKRNIVATSSIAVALFLSSYATTQAATYVFPRSKPGIYSEVSDSSFIEPEQTEDIGVIAGDSREELRIDPTFTYSLISQGFNPAQIQKIFSSASLKKDYDKLPLGE